MIEIKPQPVQLEFLQSKADIVFYGGGAGGGKVGANHCKIKTPFGDTTYKDISVGDLILNPDGSTQQVLAKYPHKHWDFYKITFCDGSSTLVGLEHLWKVSIDCGDWEVITTEEIKYLLNKSNSIEIPVTNPLDFEPKIINNKSN